MQPNYVPPPAYGPPPGWRPDRNPYLDRARQGPERSHGAVPAYLLDRGAELSMPVHPEVAEASGANDRQEAEERDRRARAEGLNRIDWNKYV